MPYNPDIHHRRSIRLKGYDYSSKGFYFVTICTQNRQHFFGKIINEKLYLNDAGKMISHIWQQIPEIHNHINLHDYIIMPNHFHAIIEISVRAESISAHSESISIPSKHITTSNRANMEFAPTNLSNNIKSAPTGKISGLPQIIQTFKRYTTIEYMKGVKSKNWQPFDKKLWQRNYYEHIIRNQPAYLNISNYIKNNPKNWKNDSNYK
ncbi:hypothetical protein L3V83_01045 [Thiotrichales bacterium 19X7-9]|nr:hypothetical protein [Thiotrichales bacterium 19X7-9]